MALLGLDFNLKRTISIILILLVVAFGLGYCSGYEAAKPKTDDLNFLD
jgi:hypothetical protein